jgi:hypothetical protein
VNLGDIIDEVGRIYGDGVNIAVRIEGLAEPGFVCISRTAYEQVKSKLKLGYEYLGEYNLKNITEPVRVYRVLTKAEDAGKVIGEKGFSNLEKAISGFRKALRPPNQNNFQVQLLLTLLYTVGNQMEQARFQAGELLRIRPFFSIKYYQYRSLPSTDEVSDKAITSLHKESLKKAGLPEERNFFNFLNE